MVGSYEQRLYPQWKSIRTAAANTQRVNNVLHLKNEMTSGFLLDFVTFRNRFRLRLPMNLSSSLSV